MIDSSMKTKVWRNATSTPIIIMGSGTRNGHEAEEDQQNKFVAVHVAEETEGERKGPAQMADDLDGQHDRRQPPDRSEEMLEVLEAMLSDCRPRGWRGIR